MKELDKKGVKVVDTTCPWVAKVWNTVHTHQVCVGRSTEGPTPPGPQHFLSRAIANHRSCSDSAHRVLSCDSLPARK